GERHRRLLAAARAASGLDALGLARSHGAGAARGCTDGARVSDQLESVFSRSLLANGKLLQMSGLSLVSIVLASELDLLNRFLNTVHMPIQQWLICIAVGSAIIWIT